MENREFTCIICPRGCRLLVTGDGEVTGNFCLRGEKYGKEEMLDPKRTLTSSILVKGGNYRLCPVKVIPAIKKGLMERAMEEIKNLKITAPIKLHQIIIKDIAGSGCDLVATGEVDRI